MNDQIERIEQPAPDELEQTDAAEDEFTLEDEAAWLVAWATDRLDKIAQVRAWFAERDDGNALGAERLKKLGAFEALLKGITTGERVLEHMLRTESPEAIAEKARREREAERARTHVFPGQPENEDDVCVLGARKDELEIGGITYRFGSRRTVHFMAREIVELWNKNARGPRRIDNLSGLPSDLLARLQSGGRYMPTPLPGQVLANTGRVFGLADRPDPEVDKTALIRDAAAIVRGCVDADALRTWHASATGNATEPDRVLALAIESRLDDLGEPLEAPDEEADESDGDEPQAPEAAE